MRPLIHLIYVCLSVFFYFFSWYCADFVLRFYEWDGLRSSILPPTSVTNCARDFCISNVIWFYWRDILRWPCDSFAVMRWFKYRDPRYTRRLTLLFVLCNLILWILHLDGFQSDNSVDEKKTRSIWWKEWIPAAPHIIDIFSVLTNCFQLHENSLFIERFVASVSIIWNSRSFWIEKPWINLMVS